MLRFLVAVAALVIANTFAQAQEYPSRPVKIVIGLPAGGGADIIARYFAEKLHTALGQTVVVENKPGAGGNLASQAVATAEADGYTLLFSTSNPLTGNLVLYKNLPFTINDFAPITTLGEGAFALAVGGKSPFKTIAELSAYLKEKNGRAAFGSPTTISLAAAEVYMQQVGVTARLVRYKSSAQALGELKAGDIDFFFIDTTGALGPVKRGEIRLLAVTTTTRNKAFADIPTIQETGIPDFDLSSWFGIFAPAKTPKPIRDKLEATINEIVARKETSEYLESIAIDAMPGSPEKLMSQVRRQTAIYRKLYEEKKLDAVE